MLFVSDIFFHLLQPQFEYFIYCHIFFVVVVSSLEKQGKRGKQEKKYSYVNKINNLKL